VQTEEESNQHRGVTYKKVAPSNSVLDRQLQVRSSSIVLLEFEQPEQALQGEILLGLGKEFASSFHLLHQDFSASQ
jgi:hypothetical protein